MGSNRNNWRYPPPPGEPGGPLRGWPGLLWAIVLLNGLLPSLLLFFCSGETNTTAGYFWLYLRGQPGTDSWSPMIRAVEHLRASPEVPVYSEIFFAGQTKFQYPPSSLLFPDLLQRLTGAPWPAVVALLDRLSWWCVPLTGIFSWSLLRDSQRPLTARPRQPGPAAAAAGLLAGAALAVTFYPLTRSYVLGQIQTALTLFATLVLWLWQRRKRKTAGFLLGLCCAVKPQWGIVLLWGALRRQWGMAAVGTVTAALLTLAAVALYGLQHFLDYLPVLSFLSRHGEGFFPNQSVNGLMNRLLFNGNNLQWVGNAFPPFHPGVYAATLAAALLLLGTALLRRRGAGTAELALIMLSLTLASPIAWEHHYGLLLPIFALLAPACRQQKPLGRHSGLYLLAAFFLASQRLDLPNALAGTRLNPLQSYLFFAAALVLMLLYRITAPASVSTEGQMVEEALEKRRPPENISDGPDRNASLLQD